jgi:hypothetical protein
MQSPKAYESNEAEDQSCLFAFVACCGFHFFSFLPLYRLCG